MTQRIKWELLVGKKKLVQLLRDVCKELHLCFGKPVSKKKKCNELQNRNKESIVHIKANK